MNGSWARSFGSPLDIRPRLRKSQKYEKPEASTTPLPISLNTSSSIQSVSRLKGEVQHNWQAPTRQDKTRQDKTRQDKTFRVLDMACGSGSFLLGAYQCLLDHCLDWYSEHKPDSFKKAVYKDSRDGHWRLTIEEKKRILTTHLFGVDIDHQAVEVTKLSLLLKVLEGETDQSFSMSQLPFGDRALPNLADNIKCGNSLIGQDYFAGKMFSDPEELKRVNPFDWMQGFPEAIKAGGFDCIIGNPPYIRIQTMKEWAPLEVEIYKELFRAGETGNYDIYVVFVEQGLQLLNPN